MSASTVPQLAAMTQASVATMSCGVVKRWSNCKTTIMEPLRAFSMVNIVARETRKFTVLMPPAMMILLQTLMSLKTVLAMVAACAGPNPGTSAIKAPASVPPVTAVELLGCISSVVNCAGSASVLVLKSKVLVPNKPDSNGKRGSFTGACRTILPSNPASPKVNRLQSRFFSRRISHADNNSNTHPVAG